MTLVLLLDASAVHIAIIVVRLAVFTARTLDAAEALAALSIVGAHAVSEFVNLCAVKQVLVGVVLAVLAAHWLEEEAAVASLVAVSVEIDGGVEAFANARVLAPNAVSSTSWARREVTLALVAGIEVVADDTALTVVHGLNVPARGSTVVSVGHAVLTANRVKCVVACATGERTTLLKETVLSSPTKTLRSGLDAD